MARTLRILDQDPEARPKVFTSDYVGRFRAGQQIDDLPVSLDAWRVTTGDPDVAAAVAERFGGSPQEWQTSKEDNLEVLTTANSVRVIIDNADAVSFRMALYGATGKPIHLCDGVEFVGDDDPRRGQPCGCPATLVERKAAEKAGYGPKPDIRVVFRLADDAALGKFRMMTGSWSFMKELETVWADLDSVGGPALCELRLELVEFTTKKGVDVSFRKPAIKVVGRAPENTDAPLLSLSQAGDEPPF
ncbi:hypothetical protein [Streptomyces sp. NPDC045470]|uniref:recombination directionality factor n=1 Tax=Streptomyces sp. NPDC045470 TaxID=3155469 RepID=UPI00340BE213